MRDKLFPIGVGCACAGFILARAAAHNGLEPPWAVPILAGLLITSVGCLIGHFIANS